MTDPRPGADAPAAPLGRALANWPIRRKLLAMVLLPLWVVLPVLGVLLMIWGNRAVDRLLVAKVRADLAVAHGYFERALTEVGASTNAAADSHALHQALTAPAGPGGRQQALIALLRQLRLREGLDFLQWQPADEQPGVSDHGPAVGLLPTQPAPAAAGQPRRAQATVEVLPLAALPGLAPGLRQRVPVARRPTPTAAGAPPAVAAPPHAVTDEALLVLASTPVHAEGGRLLGHLQAGVLLNRNLAFIDALNDIVYPPGSLLWGSRGTATLFLGDVRISTNVRLFDTDARSIAGAASDAAPPGDERALGTQVSAQVRAAVLDRGETWLDRAFVVNDWYVSGYQPLTNARGERIGMLYVGFLERPFTWFKLSALAVIGLIFGLAMAGAAWVSLRWARSIFHPLERMSRTIAALESGQRSARVGPVAGQDEIGTLAAHFDHLLDTLDARSHDLQRLNESLDAQVAQRTQALAETQQQLVQAEKLAAVGQLTASIAHEVNNPIAVIQGNLDLLRELLGPQAIPVATELRLIDQQIERMRLIVTRLLQFARPTEFAGYTEPVALAEACDEALVQVQHLLSAQGIRVQQAHAAGGPVPIHRSELVQVLVNLLLNAAQALPQGGEIRLSSQDAAAADGAAPSRVLTVADNGPGIAPDMLARLFQPFVTSKPQGTGLGLWISRTLVQRYGGALSAANAPGGGAVLTLRLPAEAPPTAA